MVGKILMIDLIEQKKSLTAAQGEQWDAQAARPQPAERHIFLIELALNGP